MQIKAPYGTQDVLPDKIALWNKIESQVKHIFPLYGYQEIRTPILEYAKLFNRAVGEATDIVEKEMYIFPSQSDEEGGLCIRPELTAPTVRTFIENNLHKKCTFQKFFYVGPAFRKERPQKGRFRQFTQIGAEAIGSYDLLVDVELIVLYTELLAALGISAYEINVNSIGCPKCRIRYVENMKKAIEHSLKRYCPNCNRRYQRNPLRILDCKVETCVSLNKGLPIISEYLCEECKKHFNGVLSGLGSAGLKYVLMPNLVRGLDYYTKTVFEITSPLLGAQNAICSGGRYDGLVKELGGPEIGASGFAAGVERMVLVMEVANVTTMNSEMDFYIVYIGEQYKSSAFNFMQELRKGGLSGDMNYEGKSVKAQMRSANNIGVRFVLLLGGDEIQKGVVKIKDMKTGEEKEVASNNISNYIRSNV